MNAAKMTLVSTVVAAVLGLALSFGASPATAHCKGKHSGNPCNHIDQDQKSQTFMVELIEDGTNGAIITGVDCIGSSERKQVTDAVFPPHSNDCDSITLATDPTLHLCQVNINCPDRPDMNMTFYFTTGEGVEGGETGAVSRSSRINGYGSGMTAGSVRILSSSSSLTARPGRPPAWHRGDDGRSRGQRSELNPGS